MIMENANGIQSNEEKARLRGTFRELRERGYTHSHLRFTHNRPSLIRTSWSGRYVFYDGAFTPPTDDSQLRLVLLHEGGHGAQLQFAKICPGIIIVTFGTLFSPVVFGGATLLNDLTSISIANLPMPLQHPAMIVGAIGFGAILTWFLFFFFRFDEYRADRYAAEHLQIELDVPRPSEISRPCSSIRASLKRGEEPIDSIVKGESIAH